MSSSVLVSIVTYNSAAHILACLQSVLEQDFPSVRIVVTDNASGDESARLVKREFGTRVELIASAMNLGFSAAHNQAIRQGAGEYVLVLNPDALLATHFVATLAGLLDQKPTLGSATGKLLRMDESLQPVLCDGKGILDSTGMEFRPNQRHRDRGAGEIDRGQYERREFVFGTTAAAGFYRRRMLDDIALGGQYFDEDFFVYREDVDLAWRAQLCGWPCGYEPRATAHHVRRGIPQRRSLLSSEINYHSTKNRFLLRLRNMPWRMYLRHFPAISARDLLVVGYSLTRETYSLKAFPYLLRHWRRHLEYRREIENRRRVPQREIEKWIAWKSVSFPMD